MSGVDRALDNTFVIIIVAAGSFFFECHACLFRPSLHGCIYGVFELNTII
jgi:hypothetical protein